MNYAGIKKCNISNGPGCRTALFVSGCVRQCPGCFNPETWDFNYGKPFTKAVEDEIIESLRPSYIRGLTLLGGEPMAHLNAARLLPFVKRVKRELSDVTIWCYTGYTYEHLMRLGFGTPEKRLLAELDVLVDGPFIMAEKDIRLRFRGSRNQRIIDVGKSFLRGEVVLWEEEKTK